MNNVIEIAAILMIVIFVLSTILAGIIFLVFRNINKMNVIDKNTFLFWLPNLNRLEYIKSFMPDRQAKILWVLVKAQKLSVFALIALFIILYIISIFSAVS